MIELNKIYCGGCLDLFKTIEDESIDCVITSPPYWQLRDYGFKEQWGLEPTFQEYLEHLWQMIDEVWRVLKPTGTAWINLGDTYNSSAAGNKEWGDGVGANEHYSESAPKTKPKQDVASKCLLLIPHRFAIGCIDRGWIMRNDIIWAKRNAMPESVTDRFSKKHEYFFLMAKNEKYYFDLDSIRDRNITTENRPHGVVRNRLYDYDSKFNKFNEPARQHRNIKGNMDKNGQTRTTAGLSLKKPEEKINELGKNPGSVSDFWDIPTQPSSDEHFAAYNDKLIGKPIVAGCPKGGIILDPFCGTATTGCRAIELGRNFIGFDGSEKYVKMGNKNLEPYKKQLQLW